MNIDTIMPFIAGSLVVGLTVLLTKKFSPKIGAMFFAFPLTFVVTIIFLHYHNISLNKKFSEMSIFSAFFIFLYIVLFYMFYKKLENIWLSLLYTTLIWTPPLFIVYSFYD